MGNEFDEYPEPPFEPDDDYFLDDEDDFVECDKCDGHDACRDFGCAFKLGLGHMVQNQNPIEW